MKPILEVLSDLVAELPALGVMRVLYHQEGDNPFGDALVDLGTQDFVIRLVREKGKLHVEAGTSQSQLFDIQLVDAVLGDSEHVPSMDDKRDAVNLLRDWIRADLQPLAGLFGNERRMATVERLLSLREKRLEKYLAKFEA